MVDDSAPGNAQTQLGEEGTRKKRRRWPWILLGLLLVFGLAVAFLLPPLAGPVIQMVIEDMGAEQGYTVTVASCTFGWRNGLRLEGISARENLPHGIRAEVRSVVVAPRWRSLLGGVLGFGRVRIDRPRLILDPARKAPDRRKRAGDRTGGSSPGTTSDTGEGGRLNLDMPLVVRDGQVEVLATADRPGFRLERLRVDGRLRGPEGHVTGRVQGDLVTGGQQKPLEMSGDLRLGDRETRPSGSAVFEVGGVDLAALAPLWTRPGAPAVERGILRARGEVRAEGALLRLTAEMNVDQLKVVRPDANQPPYEEPSLRLNVKASLEPGTRTVELQELTLHGAPVSVTARGTLRESGTARTGRMELVLEGQLERLQPFLPRDMQLAGGLKGTLSADYRDRKARVQGGLDLQALRLAMPPDDATTGAGPRVFDAARARLDLDAVLDTVSRAVTLNEVAVRHTPVDVTVKGTMQSEPDRSARLELTTAGQLERLQPFLPRGMQLAGGLQGAFTLDYRNATARLKGGADVKTLHVVLPETREAGPRPSRIAPRQAASSHSGPREIRDAHVRLDVDLTAVDRADGGRSASGRVQVAGEALRLDAELRSAALPALEVKGTLGGETARILAQAGVALPVGWKGVGAFASRYDATLNRTKAGETDYRATVRVEKLALERPGVRLENLTLQASMNPEQVQVAELRATLNGGAVTARGELDRRANRGGFRLTADVDNVQVTQALAPLLQYVVPLYHIPEGVNGSIGGQLSGSFSLEGPFPLAVDPELTTLKGQGELAVKQGFVQGSPLVGKILASLGQTRSYQFNDLATRFHVKDRAVVHDSFTARGRELAWGFKGRTGFDTAIDYRLDPGPLLERLYRRKEREGQMRGWERLLKEALKGLENAPVSLGGSLDRPALKLTNLSELAPRGKDPVNQILEGLLGGRKKK